MTTAWVLINCRHGCEERLLEELVKISDEVREARATYGSYDVVLKIVTTNADSLSSLMTMIRKRAGVQSTVTLVAIPEYGGREQ